MKLRIIFAAPVLVLCASYAAAQPPQITFDGLDTDKSGGLSKDEVATFFKNRPAGPNGPIDSAAIFGRWDANSDGTVSKEEFDARPRQGGGGPPGGGGGPPPAR
jgi:EF hand domain-containing protein